MKAAGAFSAPRPAAGVLFVAGVLIGMAVFGFHVPAWAGHNWTGY